MPSSRSENFHGRGWGSDFLVGKRECAIEGENEHSQFHCCDLSGEFILLS